MANDSRLGTDREHIPEPLVSRVLARAVELDAERNTSIPVTDLRAAALEAGVSAPSIDQALAELDTAPPARRRAPWKERGTSLPSGSSRSGTGGRERPHGQRKGCAHSRGYG